jgi:hypothetical protein
MSVFEGISTLLLLLTLVALALGIFDTVDAAVRRSDAFVAAGKLTKPAWVAINAVATVVLYLFTLRSLFFAIPAIVALLVYLVDVRPAVRAVTGGRPPTSSW